MAFAGTGIERGEVTRSNEDSGNMEEQDKGVIMFQHRMKDCQGFKYPAEKMSELVAGVERWMNG